MDNRSGCKSRPFTWKIIGDCSLETQRSDSWWLLSLSLVLEDMIFANDDNKTLATWSNLLDLFLDFYLSTSAHPQKQWWRREDSRGFFFLSFFKKLLNLILYGQKIKICLNLFLHGTARLAGAHLPSWKMYGDSGHQNLAGNKVSKHLHLFTISLFYVATVSAVGPVNTWQFAVYAVAAPHAQLLQFRLFSSWTFVLVSVQLGLFLSVVGLATLVHTSWKVGVWSMDVMHYSID